MQLPGGGVVNAPAWAGFTTWELVRGSNVVCNLHLQPPLSAALANGDDTLSITADCYSIAAADAALAAALLAYYTSAQVDALLLDYRTGTAQDAETTSAISAALLAYYTPAQVDALLTDYRTASAQDTQTQADALLAYRSWWRTARLPTRTRQRPRASPPHCSATTPSRRWTASRQAGSHGGSLGPGDRRALPGRRRGRRGGGWHQGADPGPHGRFAGTLVGSPQQRAQCGPGHPHRGQATLSQRGLQDQRPIGSSICKGPRPCEKHAGRHLA